MSNDKIDTQPAVEVAQSLASSVPALRLTTGPSLAEQAYSVVRELIMTGGLAYGERLTERGLALRLGVSPTPVRAAIARLQYERLLVRATNGTIQVVTPTLRRLREMALIQATLRGLASRLAAENATAAELQAIVAAYEETVQWGAGAASPPEVTLQQRELRRLELNRRFHRLLDEASHTPILVDMIAAATAFDWPLRVQTVLARAGTRSHSTGPEEHAEIVEVLLRRDSQQLEALVRAHALNGSEAYLSEVTQRYPDLGEDHPIEPQLLAGWRALAADAAV